MLLPCIGILALVTTGTVIWWKRRSKGETAAPPRVVRKVPPVLLGSIMQHYSDGRSLPACRDIDASGRFGGRRTWGEPSTVSAYYSVLRVTVGVRQISTEPSATLYACLWKMPSSR